jgi:DNA-binding response OmpR family regulator
MINAVRRGSGMTVTERFGDVAVVSPNGGRGQSIASYLGASGYPTRILKSLGDLDGVLGSVSADLIVLDLPLFGYDSIEEVARLSRTWGHYVLVLGDDALGIDRISALEAGADYFLDKDSEPREILAVVRAIRRRAARRTFQRPAAEYRFEGFAFDVERNLLLAPSGGRVRLTLTELALLKMFLASSDRPLARESLAAALPPMECERQLRAVDTHVSRLRQKLGYHSRSSIILTIPRRGYAFGAELTEVSLADKAA